VWVCGMGCVRQDVDTISYLARCHAVSTSEHHMVRHPISVALPVAVDTYEMSSANTVHCSSVVHASAEGDIHTLRVS
jgi:hypothetical protein